MAAIFISYRREDSASEAGRLSDWLTDRFGPTQVFIDREKIGLGDEFAKKIQSEVNGCNVLLAVIGEKWLTATDDSGRRRLDQPDDYVALEIATALQHDKLVIPVLVRGTDMPLPRDLPLSLQQLAGRHASEVSERHWKRDVEELIEKIAEVIAPAVASGLQNLATKLTAYATWSDLIVRTSVRDQLQQIVDEIVNASALAAEWRVTRPEASPGIKVLFHGEEGTGKTLAAEVLAWTLDFDLYQVDYGKVSGAQVLDTAKNLELLFDVAAKRSANKTPEERYNISMARRAGVTEAEENRTVILLFDDAEILFGTAANDPRSGSLLGLVKPRGNLIFTTTRKPELDQKLLGIFSHVVEFPFPDEVLRAEMWRHLIPPDLPIDSDLDYPLLAERFRLSGADIRKAIYAAATLAKREGKAVGMRHLGLAAARYDKPLP